MYHWYKIRFTLALFPRPLRVRLSAGLCRHVCRSAVWGLVENDALRLELGEAWFYQIYNLGIQSLITSLFSPSLSLCLSHTLLAHIKAHKLGHSCRILQSILMLRYSLSGVPLGNTSHASVSHHNKSTDKIHFFLKISTRKHLHNDLKLA